MVRGVELAVLLSAWAPALAHALQEPSAATEAFAGDDECAQAPPAAAGPQVKAECAHSALQHRAAKMRLEGAEASSTRQLTVPRSKSAEMEALRVSTSPEEAPGTAPRRLRIVNGCGSAPIWIAHSAAAEVGPDPQDVKILPGDFHDFSTPSRLMATRYWPKMGCDDSGHNCGIGSSGGPGEACQRNPETDESDYKNCAPPVDTKFEASFGQNGEPCNPEAEGGSQMKGCDFVDISLVDGWTLPIKFEVAGDCRTNNDTAVEIIDCSGLSLDACPESESLVAANMTADLRAINPITEQVSGCYSPCTRFLDTKWTNKQLDVGHKAEDLDVSPYCCPTPPESPESCRAGPITATQFLKAVHEKCPGVYGYAYDDGMGLMRCSSATNYTVTYYCPSELQGAPTVRIPI